MRYCETKFGFFYIVRSLFMFTFCCAPTFVTSVVAAPRGGSVLQGSANITYAPPITRVELETEDVVIDWQSFDLGVGETFEVVQPSQKSRLINRVQQNGISNLRGTIQSNGQVLIVNPDGVHHHSSAIALVGGLILSGLDLWSENLQGADVRLTNTDLSKAGVVKNSGIIEMADGGNAALVGRRILNEGLITGELTSVAFALGRDVNILFEANGLINVNVLTEEAKSPELGSVPLINTGDVILPSGRILLAGSSSPRVFKLLQEGEVASDSQMELTEGADFAFGNGIKIINRGSLDASNPYSTEEIWPLRQGGQVVVVADVFESNGLISSATSFETKGGNILIAASNVVHLMDGSSLDADTWAFGGSWGKGGTINILGKTIRVRGGKLSTGQGGSIFIGGNGTSPPSQLSDTADIFVDAELYNYSDAERGFIRVKANNSIDIASNITSSSQTGGEVEIISKGRLKFNATVNLRASSRNPIQNGSLLLQAKDLVVMPRDDVWVVNALRLSHTVHYGHVTLRADRNLSLLGRPSTAVFSSGPVLSFWAGNDLRLENVGFYYRAHEFYARNNIYIKETTYVSNRCNISADGNVYLTDSIFINACNPEFIENIQAGGALHISDTYFLQDSDF